MDFIRQIYVFSLVKNIKFWFIVRSLWKRSDDFFNQCNLWKVFLELELWFVIKLQKTHLSDICVCKQVLMIGGGDELNQKKNKYQAFFYSKDLQVKKKWVPLHRQLVILNYIYHFPIYRESARESRFPFLLRMRMFFWGTADHGF